MSGIFQGLTNSDGRVRSMSSTEVPAGAVQFRGMWVSGDRIVPYLVDAGQPRVFHDGIAFDAATGLLLVGDGSSVPANISMGGLRVGANGSVVAGAVTPDVIHQGVGLTYAGVLTIVPEGIPEGATFYAPLTVNTADALGAVDTFERLSDGLYQDSEGIWRTAGVNVARFETSKLLMEQSATNVFLGSSAAVTQTIVLVLGKHTLSVHGSGSATSSDNGGTATGHGTATDGAPVTIDVTVAGGILFTVSGSPDYVQVESNGLATSPVFTEAASASRANEKLEWADPANFWNQAANMVLLTLVPRFSSDDPQADWVLSMLTMSASQYDMLLFRSSSTANRILRYTDTLGTTQVQNVTWAAGDVLHIAGRASDSSGNKQVGISINGGAWSWSSTSTYSGAISLTGPLELFRSINWPSSVSDIQIFDEDLGTAWIEANYP